MTVRVVLADDQTVVRAGFRALLDLTDDLVVVAEAADGRQAVEAVRLTRPDVVLMDIRIWPSACATPPSTSRPGTAPQARSTRRAARTTRRKPSSTTSPGPWMPGCAGSAPR